MSNDSDYKSAVRRAVLDQERLLRATFSGPVGGGGFSWVKVSVRPVLIQQRRGLQLEYFTATQGVAHNYFGDELEGKLDELLSMPFKQIHVQSVGRDLHVRITRKGKALIKRGRASRREDSPVLAHDRVKRYALPADRPDEFLQGMGIMTPGGRVGAAKRGKFVQINEFIRVLRTVLGEVKKSGPICIVDCGCGRAYLTFGAYHYLNHIADLPARVIGVDQNEDVINSCEELRDSLGWSDLEFHVSGIDAFVPEVGADITLSLHACDTATDEAIVRGIVWGSKVILAAPCCQHELHHQLELGQMAPVLRHGILRERLADLLTDTLRALVLRIMGYRTRVFEFVSPEHTTKNLMIRAVKSVKPGHAASLKEYAELKEMWRISPFIEERLAAESEVFGDLVGGRAGGAARATKR